MPKLISKEEEEKDPTEAIPKKLFTSNKLIHSKKKIGFLTRFQHPKPTDSFNTSTKLDQSSSEVERCVHWLCRSPSDTEDWSKILEICDKLSRSEVDSKEAINTLRKELKHGIPSVQLQAIRLTVIFVLNSSDRLRLQIASKKFLETVEEVFQKSTKDSTRYELRDLIRKSFSLLGYEFQHDRDLQVFTHLYNKIKTPDSPMGGAPLEENDKTFTPTPIPRRSNQSDPLHSQQFVGLQPVAPVMRDLKAEAEVARNNARLLIEALAYTTPAEMESNELIQEFHSKCLHHQNQLFDDIPWATAQAEQSRLYASSITHSHPLPATNPYAPLLNGVGVGSSPDPSSIGMTKEEELLNVLLSANSELVDGFRQYDEMSRLARNEREMKIVEERSKVEIRRENGYEDRGEGGEGNAGEGGSSSSGGGEAMLSSFALSSPLGSRNPFGEEIRKQEGYSIGSNEERGIERLNEVDTHLSSPTELKKKEWIENGNSKGMMVEEPDEFLEANEIKRFEPSEKALGKMRRISGLEEDGNGNGNGNGNSGKREGKEEEEEEELRRRREEVEKKFRDRYRLLHERQEGK
ncbi:hypothetical protein DFH28DRAFT_888022 [Melampsora americana]|nr:hypothetical protein DFH28DRAFT_888022 [Melampsora americana]